MIISLIAATAYHRTLGFQGQMPWHLPADLKHFKELTLNKPIIMGRKTFDSIGKPLPLRHNIVLTQDHTWQHPAVSVAHTLDEALALAGEVPEVMIIGGGLLYLLFLPHADRIYLTEIDHAFPGDTFFPELPPRQWRLVSREDFKANEKNPYDYHFSLFVREGT